MNGLLAALVTVAAAALPRPPGEIGGGRWRAVLLAWIAAAVATAAGWALHRLLERRAGASLVPPILSFLLYGALVVGALAAWRG